MALMGGQISCSGGAEKKGRGWEEEWRIQEWDQKRMLSPSICTDESKKLVKRS